MPITIPNMPEEIGSRQQDSDAELRKLVATMIRRSGKKRPQIAEEMSTRLGRRVTTHMLNDYTARTKEASRFPAAWIEVFCEVTADDRLQRFVMGSRLRALVDLGHALVAARRHSTKGSAR